jgi:hypothetical protein
VVSCCGFLSCYRFGGGVVWNEDAGRWGDIPPFHSSLRTSKQLSLSSSRPEVHHRFQNRQRHWSTRHVGDSTARCIQSVSYPSSIASLHPAPSVSPLTFPIRVLSVSRAWLHSLWARCPLRGVQRAKDGQQAGLGPRGRGIARCAVPTTGMLVLVEYGVCTEMDPSMPTSYSSGLELGKTLRCLSGTRLLHPGVVAGMHHARSVYGGGAAHLHPSCLPCTCTPIYVQNWVWRERLDEIVR